MQDGTKDTPIDLRVKLLERQLEELKTTKANKSETEIEMGFLGRDIQEAKEVAMEAKAQASGSHPCKMEGQVNKIWEKINGWDNWRLKIYGSIIAFILTVGVAWGIQFFSLKNSVNQAQISIEQVDTSVKKIETSHYQLERAFEKSKTDQRKIDSDQLKQISDTVKAAIAESRDRGSRNPNR